MAKKINNPIKVFNSANCKINIVFNSTMWKVKSIENYLTTTWDQLEHVPNISMTTLNNNVGFYIFKR
jgi:hypothetical protein